MAPLMVGFFPQLTVGDEEVASPIRQQTWKPNDNIHVYQTLSLWWWKLKREKYPLVISKKITC